MPHSTVAPTTTIDGHQVDVASLETIDFGRLATKEPDEVEKLLNASQMPGFFYLDLQNERTKQILADLPAIYAASEKYFDEPHEVKMKDYRDGQDIGWVHYQRLLGQMLTPYCQAISQHHTRGRLRSVSTRSCHIGFLLIFSVPDFAR